MGPILWIDENTFITTLLERVFKNKDLHFYALSTAIDFSYLVADLSPLVIVFDAKTALKDLESVKLQYEASSGFMGTPVILIDPLPGLEFISNKLGEIKKPLDPFKVPDQIKALLRPKHF